VSPLADVVPFDTPPIEWSSHIKASNLAQKFLYYGLAPSTRRTYSSYQLSYENFCLGRAVLPYPASVEVLAEWISVRAFGSTDPGQSALKADSILQALSAVRSVHIDRCLSTSVFNTEYISRIIAGIRRLQGREDKRKAEPLSINQLEQITSPAPDLGDIVEQPAPGLGDDDEGIDETLTGNLPKKQLNQLNADAALKLAFAGFFRTKEITYENSDLVNKAVFEHTKLQRRDIAFADNDEHVVITLRNSKCDYDHTGVEILIAGTDSPVCAVQALRALFTLDPQPPRAPLFRTYDGPFSRQFYITTMRNRLKGIGCKNYKNYAGHSLRRGAAQHAADNGILEYDIQRLGRWSSAAFKGYFHISHAYKYALNRRFLTGKALPVIQTSRNVI
jgi:integrase